MINRDLHVVRTYTAECIVTYRAHCTYTPHFRKWSSRSFCLDVLILIQQSNQKLEVGFTDANTVRPVPNGGSPPKREKNLLISFIPPLSSNVCILTKMLTSSSSMFLPLSPFSSYTSCSPCLLSFFLLPTYLPNGMAVHTME